MKQMIKRLNDIACGSGGWLYGTCQQSTSKQNSYILLSGLAIVMQYAVPVVFMMILFPMIMANIAISEAIEFLKLINPFFVIGYIPLAIADSAFAAISIIVFVAGSIFYWYFYYKHIGILMIAPFLAWIASIIVWFIPVIGPVISVCIALIPWLPVMAIVHWWIYS